MSFRDIVGHRRLKRLMARAVQSGTLPPSLLFAGPDGIGKRQMGHALAQALNCLDAGVDQTTGDWDACGVCPTCSRISRGLHPDVMLVRRLEDKAGISVEQVRDLNRQVGYRPFEGRHRVVIIDEADGLNSDSQDALLKTLEEPPPRNVFVLVTARPGLLATTVRSRCCVLRFSPVAPGDIAAALVARHGFTEQDAQLAAALSAGSFARAMEPASGERAKAREVAADVLTKVSRTDDPRVRLETSTALLKAAGRKQKETGTEGKSTGADRQSVADRVRAMGSLLRDLAVLTTRAPESALVNLDLRADLELLSGYYDRERLARAFSAVGRSLVALERHNASPKIVADWLALQL